MIYLAGKIFFYLVLALGLGAAAGWLWRNLQAVNREVALERQLVESRSRMPQLETAVRSREQQLEAARADLEARDQAMSEHETLVAERDRLAAELARTREAALRHREAEPPSPEPVPAASADATLALHPGDPAGTPAEPAPGIDHGEREALEQALAETRAELAEAQQSLERANRALAGEQRRVQELTRERELQSLSLKALEQQLEMAREAHPGPAVANG